MYGYLPFFHVGSEVVQLDIEMFGAWSEFVYLRHLQCPAVVFEYLTMHFRLGGVDLDLLLLHLF